MLFLIIMNNKKLKIGFDFDGVFSDCGDLKSKAAKKLYNKDIPKEKFKRELVIGGGILTEDEYSNLQKQIYRNDEYADLMDIVPGVLDFLPKIQEIADTKIITSRSGEYLEVAKRWLEKKGIKINAVGVGKDVSKLEAAKGLDVYIDDDFDKLEPLIGSVSNLFLFEWGYNSHVEVPVSVRRVKNWEEFYKEILKINK